MPAEARVQEEFFARAFVASPIGIALCEVGTGRVLHANDAFARLLQIEPATAVDRRLDELGFGAQATAAFDAGVGGAEARVQTSSGRELFVEVSSGHVSIAGAPATLLFVSDVSRQREQQRQLKESEEKYAKVFQATPYAISIVDLETRRYVDVNEAFERLFGLKREQVVGRDSVELGLWHDLEERARVIELARKGGTARGLPSGARTERGVVRGFVAAAIMTVGGREHLCLIAPDATEQTETDRARAQLEAHLREAQKLEALGTLAGGIAHDFNNLLSAIMAYADLIKLAPDNPKQVHSYITELRTVSERAAGLVRQILAFSRRQKQELKPLQLTDVIVDALKLLRAALPATIEIRAQLDPATPLVMADAGQIHQILMNLGTNAAHAMQAGQGQLVIGLEPVELPQSLPNSRPHLHQGRAARLTVSDTGSGMDAATMERIFEPFFTTKAPGEGTGLGLAVVHGIAVQHNAAISVQSQPGQGTRFELHFPEHAPPLETEDQPEETWNLGHGEHVLLVEDDPRVLQSLRLLIEWLGYRATACPSPFDALARFRDQPDDFDLVLTDLTMPGMTGVDVAREALAIRPQARIMLMSGFSANWSLEALRSLGITSLLAKPIGARTLATALHAALHGH
jgi:two-component system, cell cycle sensor histidine kinase and response regulator CckA